MSLDEPIRDGVWPIVAVVRGGRCPLMDFLDAIDDRADRNRVLSLLDYVSHEGPNSLKEKSKLLRDKIFELRPSKQIRILYFYDDEVQRRIILTHAIVKKTDKVAPGEIERAIDLRRQYLTAGTQRKESF